MTEWITVVVGVIGTGFGAFVGVRVALARLESAVRGLEKAISDLSEELDRVEGRLQGRIKGLEDRVKRLEEPYFRHGQTSGEFYHGGGL